MPSSENKSEGLKASLLSSEKTSYGTSGVNLHEYRSFSVYESTNTFTPEGSEYADNYVVTSNYTWYNFFPKNLYEQFCNIANLYFLAIGILQMIPQISTTDGIPTMYESLSFIILVGMFRAGSEDWAKHKADATRNKSPYLTLGSNGFEKKQSGELLPGDIVKIKQDQMIPADIIFLSSSLAKQICFIDKANLNGETKLEVMYSLPEMRCPTEHLLRDKTHSFRLFYEEPNGKFDQFQGYLDFQPPSFQEARQMQKSLQDGQSVVTEKLDIAGMIPITGSHLVMRETTLRNTEFIYGMVVYTGDDTKIQQSNNSTGSRQLKKSKIMRYVDGFLRNMLIFQSSLCLFGGIFSGIWTALNYDVWYLRFDESAFVVTIQAYFTWYILLCQMIPIALIVSAEMVKFISSSFIQWDHSLYYSDIDQPMKCNSSVIHEELGFVDYIFSDKTGTLTQNKMEFRYALLENGSVFGSAETEISRSVASRMEELRLMQEGKLGRQAVPWETLSEPYATPRNYRPDFLDKYSWWAEASPQDAALEDTEEDATTVAQGNKFSDQERAELLAARWDNNNNNNNDTDAKNQDQLNLYLTHMALSNTVTPYSFRGELKFQSESAEEAAMAEFARSCGYTKLQQNPTLLEITHGDKVVQTVEYNHLATFPFSSNRARVTVIYEDVVNKNIHVMSKGQDTVMLPLMGELKDEASVLTQLKNANSKGIRTLVMSYSVLPVTWWEPFQADYDKLCEDDTEQGTTRFDKLMTTVEKSANLQYLGCLGFEDQLQDLVPQAIRDCLRAGIKVWMITGDKLETAKNIGLACNLIDPDMLPVVKDGASVTDTLAAGTDSRLIEVTGQWSKLSQDTKELEFLFDIFDTTGDGSISLEELRVCLAALKFSITSEKLLQRFNQIAPSGALEKAGFVTLMRTSRLSMYDAVQYDIEEGLRRYQEIQDNTLHPVSVLINRDAFKVMFPEPGSKIEKTEDELEHLRQMFFLLASVSKSVVFARAQPAMKKRMVTEIKARNPTATTLAIGDGANDTDMIRAAHVGVGISGIEGTAAVSAADYAIGTFRYVHTLLFVHGYWSTHRISVLVNFVFYKACLLALTQYYIGFASGFSGQQFFDDPIYQLYNLLFTAAPVLVVGIFERPLPRVTLENNPSVYSENKRVVFRKRAFYGWILRAILHSFISFYIPLSCLGNPGQSFPNGKMEGFYYMSTVSYLAIAIMPNFLIIYEIQSMTVLHHISIWGSIICVFFFVWFVNLFLDFDPRLYGVVDRIYGSVYAFLILLITIALPLLIEHLYRSVMARVFPTYTQFVQEKLAKIIQMKEWGEVEEMTAEEEAYQLSIRKSYAARKVVQTLEDEKQWNVYKSNLPDINILSSPKATLSRFVSSVEAKVGRSSASPVVKAATTAAAPDDADDIKMNNAIMRALLHLRHLNGENLADKTGKTQLQKHDALSSKTPTLMTEGKISS